MSNFFSRFPLFLLGLAFGGWLSGLFLFITQVSTYDEPAINDTLSSVDAIVVLTGGSERLGTGLSLLAAGKGRKLFISGVPQGLTLNNVLANRSIKPELRDCCIVLGHAADNTIGNAKETLAWINGENFHSLRLVTANYHMPRSLLVFREFLPDIVITPHVVAPESVDVSHWWKRYGTARLLIIEYNKYLYVMARAWWASRHE
jgi:uncharacterized SAM-binding protein YcdF (DUF218 family)